MTVPQIYLFLDSAGNLHAELPAINGLRRKIDLTAGAVETQIRAALRDEADRVASANRRRTQSLQTANIQRALAAGANQGETFTPKPVETPTGVETVLCAEPAMDIAWSKRIWGEAAVRRAAHITFENAKTRMLTRDQESRRKPTSTAKPEAIEVESL